MENLTSSSKCKGPICKIKRYLVVYVYDNHIWDVIIQADSAEEAEQKVYATFKTNSSDIEHSVVKEITQKQAKDTDCIDGYIQEWKNETFKSE